MVNRIMAVAGCMALAVLAYGQTLQVTSPNDGDYLGTSNQVKFTLTGATSQAKIVATTKRQGDPSTSFRSEGLFDPNVDFKVNASLNLNFDEATPLGLYDIEVLYYQKGVVVDSTTIKGVNIDTRNPKFKNVTPASGAFVSQFASIRATIEETNLDLWTVQVNNRDIPNNTGTTNSINVGWDTTLIEKDGSQSITITVKDKARNTATRNISVTLDRVAPTIAILSPAQIPYRQGTQIPVSINITDQASNSVTNGGVNVVLKSMTGQFLGRVARRSSRSSDKTLQWTGRISASKRLPKQFKLVVTAVDRAGNEAQSQEVVVTIGG